MRVLHSFATFTDGIAISLMKPIAVMGAALGIYIAFQFGAILLLAGAIALPLLWLGFLLDPPPNSYSDLRMLGAAFMLGVAWLLIWCFLAGLLTLGVVAVTQ